MYTALFVRNLWEKLMRTFVAFLFVVLCTLSSSPRADEFDRYHPDQYYRQLGFEAWDKGDADGAVKLFQRAARYADKPSQLALAFAYWGEGPIQNRPLAYAWADVAAERGYPDFLSVRERYWEALEESERESAKKIGASLADEYGDARAKKRLESLLRQGLSKKTGSRTGSGVSGVAAGTVDSSARAAMIAATSTSRLNNLVVEDIDREITVKEAEQQMVVGRMRLLAEVSSDTTRRSTSNYYADSNWKPKAYWAYQDAMWMELDGIVEVKALRRRNRNNAGSND
jgi:hypothetical protein